jgi:transposase
MQTSDLLQPYLYRARSRPSGSSTGLNIGIVATRYDKPAANYLAFVQLASIRLWLSR